MRKAIISILIVFGILAIILFGNYPISSEKDIITSAQGDNAPDFTLIDINNNSFTLSEHRGEVVLINFMCAPSAASQVMMKVLNNIHDQVGNETIMISIDVLRDDTREDIEYAFGEYVDKWIFALDTEEEDMILKYNVYEIPRIIIVDTLGDISYDSAGITDEEIILEEIDKADIYYPTEKLPVLLLVGLLFFVFIIIVIIIVSIDIYRRNKK